TRERPDDGVASGLARETFEAQVVVEDAGDCSLEAVELREGVLAQGDEDVCPSRAAHDGRELGLERATLRAVEEVLLGLVEQKVDVASRRGRPVHGLCERAGLNASSCGQGLRDRAVVELRPGGEYDDDRVLGKGAQAARDGSGQQRRLPDSA